MSFSLWLAQMDLKIRKVVLNCKRLLLIYIICRPRLIAFHAPFYSQSDSFKFNSKNKGHLIIKPHDSNWGIMLRTYDRTGLIKGSRAALKHHHTHFTTMQCESKKQIKKCIQHHLAKLIANSTNVCNRNEKQRARNKKTTPSHTSKKSMGRPV